MFNLFVYLFLSLSCFAPSHSWAQAHSATVETSKSKFIVGFAFDWDDNIFEMPTQIMLFDKNTGEQRGISTDEFALMRSLIGKAGTPWEGYELRSSSVDGSLRYFGDTSKEGAAIFAQDVKRAMTSAKYHWQGPVWKDFVHAMRHKQTADQTWIITARRHSPKTIHSALIEFQNRGLIKNVLPVENVWVVGYEEFDSIYKNRFGRKPPEGGSADPSARKAAVMENILDGINGTSIPASAPKTLASIGNNHVRQHLWGFSDDDFGNFNKARDVLQNGVDANRWPNVKITLFFTGTNHPTEKPQAVVLRSKMAPRPFSEKDEWKMLTAKTNNHERKK
jgi:hypothetical protein